MWASCVAHDVAHFTPPLGGSGDALVSHTTVRFPVCSLPRISSLHFSTRQPRSPLQCGDHHTQGQVLPLTYLASFPPACAEALMADQREEEEMGGSSPAKPSGVGPPRQAVKLARPKGQSRFIDTEAELSDDGEEGEEDDDEDGEDDGTLVGVSLIIRASSLARKKLVAGL